MHIPEFRRQAARWVFAVAGSIAAASTAPGAAQPAGAPVKIDFRVVAEDGEPVLDLKPPDISLKVNGRVREIRSLELVQLGAAPGAAPQAPLAPPFASNVPSEPGRDLFITVDDGSIAPGKEQAFREAALLLIGTLTGHDRVALLSVRQGGVNIGLTSQHATVRAAATTLIGGAPGTESAQNAACRGRVVLDSLKTLLASAGDRPLAVVFFSASLQGPNTERLTGLNQNSQLCQFVTDTFQQFGVTASASPASFHVVQLMDAAGPIQTADGNTLDPQSMTAGLENLAGVTGTAVIRLSGNAQTAMARVSRETSAYYLAGFDPEPSERNGAAARVELRVSRERVKVRARPEITIGRAGGKADGPKVALRDILRGATVYRDLPIRAAAFASRNTGGDPVKIVAVFEPVDPTAKLAAAMVGLVDDKDKLIRQWTAQEADLAKAPFLAAVPAPSGNYRVRVAALDASGRAGSTEYPLQAEIAGNSLKLSTMLLGVAQGAFAPRLQFSSEQAAVGMLELYGVPKGATVAATFELAATEDGPSMATAPGRVAQEPAEDIRIAYGGFEITGLQPGDYVVRALITLDDKPAGRAIRTLRKAKP